MSDEPIKKELTPEQIMSRQVRGMSDRQMSRRLHRIARSNKSSNIDSVWAVILSEVIDNTKPLGKLEPFLL